VLYHSNIIFIHHTQHITFIKHITFIHNQHKHYIHDKTLKPQHSFITKPKYIIVPISNKIHSRWMCFCKLTLFLRPTQSQSIPIQKLSPLSTTALFLISHSSTCFSSSSVFPSSTSGFQSSNPFHPYNNLHQLTKSNCILCHSNFYSFYNPRISSHNLDSMDQLQFE
jgi:hypothetical protein